ncbi:hypothetical protein LTS07_001358 [Exophiala sideris]|uniref:Uncharacterized protein n=1 Tax=Exophiala sideris TaxID=1016849 RepID=A0ABR0JN77_9EURO|nr:hypothetical protein LTS07_001358 [Exophiala sideris]KAK5043874.1 hypothetical protein LTR13_000228 [Exophiala sideris]KAK5067373.1 hypothetical protein LTR69_001360 [Exophiala sideris]KAK5182706.1 hypothetical protein LTR44_005097 [Eurotiomycetes sp. CCFEE 6388]
MWPLWLIILVAVAGAVVILVTGVCLAVKLERRRHRQILQRHLASTDHGRYHRPSRRTQNVDYQNVPVPTTSLRRSVQMPFGIVTIASSNSLTSTIDEEKEAQTSTTTPFDPEEGLRQKQSRKIRNSFSGRSLYNPKSRRQQKIGHIINLTKAHTSPLSAITEFTDSHTCTSPANEEFLPNTPTVAEPKKALTKTERQVSIQWPFAMSKARTDAAPTEVMSMAARASMLVRMYTPTGRPNHTFRPPTMPRSVSINSTTSSAPDDPLPPLPTADTYKRSRSDPRTRASSASLETISSSVLGMAMSSPSAGTDRRDHGVAVKAGLTSFEFPNRCKTPTNSLQAEPTIRKVHGLCSTVPDGDVYHFRNNVAEHSPARTEASLWTRPVPRVVADGDAFKTIDASTWERPFPLNNHKLRVANLNRHSMIESSRMAQWRAASDSLMARANAPEATSHGRDIRRPASVATGNLLQWDLPGERVVNRHSWSFPEGPKRGHRRQNCVRITNLPTPELKPKRVAQLPELEEEQQPLHQGDNIDDADFGIGQPEPIIKVRPLMMEISSSQVSTPTPSPFKNRPVLNPGTRPPRKQYIKSPSRVPENKPPLDLNTSFDDGPPDALFGTPQQLPLSLTPKNSIRLNSTPPSAQDSDHPPYHSPILPSPALKSSLLYPYKSLVKGPRNPWTVNPMIHTTQASPLRNKQNPTVRMTKNRRSGEVDLRKSIMLLRSLNSEGRLLEHSGGRTYHEVDFERGDDLAARMHNSGRTFVASSVSGALQNYQGTTLNHSRATCSTLAAPQPQHLSASPSTTSIGAGSIWEDASVRGESPTPSSDLENEPISLRHDAGGTPIGLYGEENTDPPSTLVQNLERAANTHIWNTIGTQHHPQHNDRERNKNRGSPLGLGLIMDSPTLPSYG